MNKKELKYRYPGAQPFTTHQQQIFFGRTKDIENLHELINLENLVVLYSKSGLGKSSLINAGLIPKIHSESDFEPFSIRFGAHSREQSRTPVNTTSQKIVVDKVGNSYLDNLIPRDNSFWYFVKNRQEQQKNKNKGLLLIFDQFEELFTYPDEEILKFKKELKEILNNQIPHRFRKALEEQFENGDVKLTDEELELFHKNLEVKVLIAVRSDRMSMLNDLKDYLPSILRHCYELEALSLEQTEDAILNPALKEEKSFISPTFDYENKSLDAILQFLTKNYTQKIESFQLQILCQNIEKKVINHNLQTVTLADIGDIESVYKNHYDNLIKGIGTEEEQLVARRLIEEGLIFEEEERRLSLYEGQIFKTFEVSPELLKRLIDSHILRAEPSMRGGYTYELCHDTLIPPVLKSKTKRIEEERRRQADIERQKREKELEEQKKKLEKEKTLKERALKAQKSAESSTIKAKRFATIMVFLLFMSFVVLIFAWYQYQEARKQERVAQKERIKAESAKSEALQSLNNFLKEQEKRKQLEVDDKIETAISYLKAGYRENAIMLLNEVTRIDTSTSTLEKVEKIKKDNEL